MEKKEKVVNTINKKREKFVEEKKNDKQSKKKKENIFSKIGKYFKGVAKEVKRIRWTDKKDLLKYSVATVIFVLFFGIYFYLIQLAMAFIKSII